MQIGVLNSPSLCVAVCPQGRSPGCAGLSLQPIGCTPALSVTKAPLQRQFAVCDVILVMGFNCFNL